MSKDLRKIRVTPKITSSESFIFEGYFHKWSTNKNECSQEEFAIIEKHNGIIKVCSLNDYDFTFLLKFTSTEEMEELRMDLIKNREKISKNFEL